jgi:integrase|tara:strand:- start:10719 stop:11840 length:1122 start_codon:yes stop_codon:yes gene_type:complete
MTRKIPKYTRREVHTDAEGNKQTVWVWMPPLNARNSGFNPIIVEASRYRSYNYIQKENERLFKWQQDLISRKIPTDKSTLHSMFRFYKTTNSFNKLREQTQRDYCNVVNSALMIKIKGGVMLGNIKLGVLSRQHTKLAYEKWLERGVRTANMSHSVLRKVLNVAIEYDIIQSNPLTGIEKQQEHARKVSWTKDQVKLFLNTAYGEWKWRNIGLIAHMAYEWCQRVGDMRKLKWDTINFEDKVLTLEQSKRRAEVFLPISDNLIRMLTQQNKDFGFQEYVAPSVRPFKGVYRPYSITQVSSIANQVKATSGLPRELHVMDMRRTGITEMVDSGVDITQIMSVSGHQNVQSVTPYIKHTLAASKSALSKRQSLDY